VGLSLFYPELELSNGYIFTSLFLAFAYLYPDYPLYIFFILPVKVKWLGIIAWIGILGSVLLGPVTTKILAVISVSNFLLFFGREILESFGHVSKVKIPGPAILKETVKANHICSVCGENEIKNPSMVIRYCTKCNPPKCFCGVHIKDHKH
jgi:hypothetical protein